MSSATDRHDSHADPILSASLLAPDALDRALVEVVHPLLEDLATLDGDGRTYLWVMRYGKGGQHLKLRVHGPRELAERLRDALAERAEAWLRDNPPSPETEPNPAAQAAPSVDPEDDEPWDGGLRWTTYRRNYVNLAGPPFLDDDRYASLATECLGRGCAQAIPALRLGPDGRVPGPMRQQILLRLLIPGLGSLAFEARRRLDYLAYHRDWLIRFCLPPGSGEEQVAMVRGRLDQQLARMAPAVAQIRTAIESLWGEGAGSVAEGAEDQAADPWCDALRQLRLHTEELGRDPRFHIDPQTDDPVFAPLFKTFHGMGNVVGIPPLEEAFTHHLLLHAAGAETDGE